jgi:hypothetical protein
MFLLQKTAKGGPSAAFCNGEAYAEFTTVLTVLLHAGGTELL